MIANVQLDYYVFKQAMPPEKYANLREAIPALPIEQPVTDFYHTNQVADVRKLLSSGVEFTVKSELSTSADWMVRLLNDVEEMRNKLCAIQDQKQTINDKVSVHVPGHAMMEIKTAKVLEDCCTNALNEELMKGWKILAICPQPNQRRPDYIVGHTSDSAF